MKYPPPNDVILSNLANELLSNADFYVSVMDLAEHFKLSRIWLKKVVNRTEEGHRGHFLWIPDDTAVEETDTDDSDEEEERKKERERINRLKRKYLFQSNHFLTSWKRRCNSHAVTGTAAAPIIEINLKPDCLEKFQWLSKSDLKTMKLPKNEILDCKVFNNYESGVPSNKLYVKNIPRKTTRADLLNIFRSFLQIGQEPEVKLFTSGKLHGQAFVTLPDVDIAKKALKYTNGILLNGKPIVVMFAKSR